jgi:hypothetical protein
MEGLKIVSILRDRELKDTSREILLLKENDCGELVRVPYQRPRNCGIVRSPRGEHKVPFPETNALIGAEPSRLETESKSTIACTVRADALLLTLAFLWVLVQVGY